MDRELEANMTSFDASKGDRIDPVARACRSLYLRVELCPCMQRPMCRQCENDKQAIEDAWNASKSLAPVEAGQPVAQGWSGRVSEIILNVKRSVTVKFVDGTAQGYETFDEFSRALLVHMAKLEALSNPASYEQGFKDGYLRGFNSSGEGYNGEFPFGDKGRNPEDDESWRIGRDAAIRAKIKAAEGRDK